MKVLMINTVCGIGSTGRICVDLAQELEARGNEVKIAYGRNGDVPECCKEYAVRIGTDTGNKMHGVVSRLFDAQGLGSVSATKKFLKWVDSYSPDLIWLHNLHGYYINYELLFSWIKKHPSVKVKWTLHDCWGFTGHCTHFDFVGCDKWKGGCGQCPQKQEYPRSILWDRSRKNWERKRRAFTAVSHLEIITPSHWLAGIVKQSFLSRYPVHPIPNGIDIGIFHPTESDLRKTWGLEGKKILLGVSSVWNQRKGAEIFKQLADMLDPSWKIVMIGVPRNRQSEFPSQILMFDHLEEKDLLAKWYTAADVFLNPSYEETMGLTTVEALACGTPVILFDRTAVPELIDDTCGIVIREETAKAIMEALPQCSFPAEACINRASRYTREIFIKNCCDLIAE
ncbi:MAG: glycosyltransferase [Candidatus Limivicinus sp.]|nr:glycosyltransferase [Candidatus Limivicinus sp.]